jgi:hypothetical protein
MVGKLLEFLEIDSETRASASVLSDVLIPHLDDVIDRFYKRVNDYDIDAHVTDQVLPMLKAKQKQHWMGLFRSQFQEDYFASVRRIGMRHHNIALSPMWYMAGYTWLKLAFNEVIIKSELPAETKGHLVKTLDKYVAIDMALALSTYSAVIME